MKFDTSKALSVLLLFVLISLLTRWLSLAVEILDMDEAAHIIGSWQLMDGKLLYTDFVDNKPPLIYAYYALAQTLFGRGMFSVHLFTLLILIPAIAWGVYTFYDRSRTGLVAALIFLIYSAAFLAHDMLAANTELLMILPGVWALTFVNTPERALRLTRISAASFLLGVGVLCKHQIAFWLPAIGIAAAFECGRNKKHLLLMKLAIVSIISFLTPLLLTYFAFQLQNGEKALITWTITNNLVYAANPVTMREVLGRAASYLLPFLILTSPLWFFAVKSRAWEECSYRKILLLSLILFSIPPAFIGFRFFPHYFIQLYIPLALASAPYVWRLLDLDKARPFIKYSLILLAFCAIVNVYLYLGNTAVYRERDPIYQAVARELRRLPCYDDANLFVWGYSPEFYYYARLPIASRFALMSQSGLTAYISGNLSYVRDRTHRGLVLRQESWPEFLGDLDRNRCTYIIDTAPAGIHRWDEYPITDYPLLHNYIQKHYQLVATVDQVDIYQRTACN